MEPTKAKANPTKAFFERMITRDITVEDCIFDLIDNSIDGAMKRHTGKRGSFKSSFDLSNYKIEIIIEPDGFSIKDNCGGIDLEDAVNYAFTFGRMEEDKPEKYSIGFYGIGMKRAVFKLGEDISITSTYLSSSRKIESFRVPIQVQNWLKSPNSDWDFDIEGSDALEQPGVQIVVRSLRKEIRSEFSNPIFIKNLIRKISREYSLYLRQQLSISVNGEKIKGWNIELLNGGSFIPMSTEYSDDVDGRVVKVEILAGVTSRPVDNAEPSDDDDTENRYGWYVICNRRIVLAADKSSLSGWGTPGHSQWHPQYNGFVGIVIFSSEYAGALPLTTTKRSVDVSSDLFKRARVKMIEVAKQWTKYTNVRKQSLEDAKKKESEAILKSIFDIEKNSKISFPTFNAKKNIAVANISFSVDQDKMRKLAQNLGDINMKNKDVGIKSFDYTYKNYVGDE